MSTSASKKRPTFFIAGAPKSGTTALYKYLRRHPLIFLPKAKEPHYFAEDFPRWRFRSTEQEYLALFQSAPDECELLGEASPWYLYSTVALKNIRTFEPGAKIILMLRNPIELVHAQHAQNVYNCDESEDDFEAAWALEAERRSGRAVPKDCRSVEMLFYSEIAKLGTQLERARSIFPKEQIHCLLFDDFVSDTEAAYRKVLEFLGMPEDGQDEFERINENRSRRFPQLARFVERRPEMLEQAAGTLRRVLGVEELGLYRLATALTTRRSPRRPLSAKMKQLLVESYRSEILKLSEELGRDLGHWLRNPESSTR